MSTIEHRAATSTEARGGQERDLSPVRLAILDDHDVLRDSLGRWITDNASDFDVVLTAPSWLQLVHSPQFPTDLVFIDFPVDEPVSIEARVRTCRAAGAKVIVRSSVDTLEARERALTAGAAAFLSKSLTMAAVMETARRVMGRSDPEPRVWQPTPGESTVHRRPKLSPGESEALRLYATGLSTPEVAARMNVQYETAKTYLRRVRQKYARVARPASKKVDLIRRAAEDGYLG